MGGGGRDVPGKGLPPMSGGGRDKGAIFDKCLCCIFLSPIYSHAQYQM